jgi:hypothetical protein
MSEHISISGAVDFYHLPYRESDGFTACQYCLKKDKFSDRLRVEFHEGFGSDWMKVVCTRCKKTIWVANLEGRRKMIKDNKKCEICKKPTNHYDCYCTCFSGLYKKKKIYLCSKKCSNSFDKILRDINKKMKGGKVK